MHWATGSPPQVRGKPTDKALDVFVERITPAGAGKTFYVGKTHWERRDHPRRCGENTVLTVYNFLALGITPAGAGKTATESMEEIAVRDHPRRCGENCLSSVWSKEKKGSPPQVRGKPMPDGVTVFLIRITPAGAGKTIFSCFYPINNQDHPRRCGENVNKFSADF